MPESAITTDKSPSIVTNKPSIFIGFVSFVGIDTEPIVKSLEDSFKQFNYQPIHIKISNCFSQLAKDLSLPFNRKNGKNRIEDSIAFGNDVREKYGDKFLAKYAISEIIENRDNGTESPHAYIIDQLKTKEEIELLKLVYDKSFFQISIYSARDRRVDYLAGFKAKQENTRDAVSYRAEAEKLVNQDYNEPVDHGQKTGKIFQLADFIINADNVEKYPIKTQIERFVELLFGSQKHSPTHIEYGMYLAHSAALRSLDLSRQVGAAIFRPTGEVATLGCNEVAKAGGGTYWCDEVYDAREYKKGEDNNDKRKQELLNEVLKIIGKDWNGLSKQERQALKDSQFMDALEYGRIVHAEMNAITDAARLGVPLKNTILYCTTFPCHMCAKLIIASGVKKVMFLEPYPKSLTADMHSDSVKIDGTSRGPYEEHPAVEFNHFFGVTAQRYSEIFQRGKRKSDEGVQEYKEGTKNKAQPIFTPYSTQNNAMEDKAANDFNQIIKQTKTDPV